MTEDQALQILDQAASRALLPREDHYRIQLAVETLKQLILSAGENKKPAKLKEEHDNRE
jgi:hypothetical protein